MPPTARSNTKPDIQNSEPRRERFLTFEDALEHWRRWRRDHPAPALTRKQEHLIRRVMR